MSTRTIGITPRRKRTSEGEARPTKVAIRHDGQVTEYDLATATDELDFLKGTFPIKWRKVNPDEEISWFSEENPEGFRPHHCKWRKLKKSEDVITFPAGHVRVILNEKGMPVTEVLTGLPVAFDGLSTGDRVSMFLGGSGDRFAAGLSNRGEKISAAIYRIPPNYLKKLREARGANKEDDHKTLAILLEEKLAEGGDIRPFYKLRARDRDQIRVKECYQLRTDALKDRIACQQRILQAAEGRVFLNEEGHYPQGRLEDAFKQLLANDEILQGLTKEEKRRTRELQKAVQSHPLWAPVFAGIEGCGERLAAGLIVATSDIRRFWEEPDPREMESLASACANAERDGQFAQDRKQVADRITPLMNHYQILHLVRDWQRANGKEEQAKFLDAAIGFHKQRSKLRRKAKDRGMYNLRAQCGVHVLQGGKYAEVPWKKSFPRQRHGETSNWHPAARQALYLLADQCNRRPASEWGQKLLHYKAQLRASHPQVEEYTVTEGGKEVTKKRYTDGHIHKMAIWHTLTKFVDHIFRTWTRIEEEAAREADKADRESGGTTQVA